MIREQNFEKWLETGLGSMKNEGAFCLNLYDEDEEWVCELVGTNKFFKDENYWYFEETKVYNRETPYILLTDYKNGDFEKLYKEITKMIEKTLKNNDNIKNIVTNKKFAFGFVDSALTFLNTNANA